MKKYDLIVIGSGGGTKLGLPIAKNGYKVALIEEEKLGGTCLNRGCIPSKMLIRSADIASMIDESERYGIILKDKKVLFKEIVERVASVVDHESDNIKPKYEKEKNLTLYKGHARFLDNHTLQVGNEVLFAEKIVIAVGAEASVPEIRGLEGTPYMTYREALRNTRQPKNLVVIGGGYIAVELGYFYGALGTKVHFLARSSLLKKEDLEVQKEFEKAFSKKFAVHKKSLVQEVKFEDGIFTIFYEEDGIKKEILADALLVATGIKPNTFDLGLENTDIELNEEGFIQVDNFLGTKAKGVFAMGDCIGRYLFRHNANFEGEYLQKQLFERRKEEIFYKPMPHAVFTNPQIASIGKTEEQLKKENIPYIKGFCSYKDSAMGMAMRSEYGFVKLLFHKESRKLIGAHIIGEEASILIHMPIAFINMEATLEDVVSTIYIHPALAEVIRNAARDAEKNFQE